MSTGTHVYGTVCSQREGATIIRGGGGEEGGGDEGRRGEARLVQSY